MEIPVVHVCEIVWDHRISTGIFIFFVCPEFLQIEFIRYECDFLFIAGGRDSFESEGDRFVIIFGDRFRIEMLVVLVIARDEKESDSIRIGKVGIQIGDEIDHDIEIFFILGAQGIRSDILDRRQPVPIGDDILISRRTDAYGFSAWDEFWVVHDLRSDLSMHRIIHIPVHSKKRSKRNKRDEREENSAFVSHKSHKNVQVPKRMIRWKSRRDRYSSSLIYKMRDTCTALFLLIRLR